MTQSLSFLSRKISTHRMISITLVQNECAQAKDLRNPATGCRTGEPGAQERGTGTREGQPEPSAAPAFRVSRAKGRREAPG